MIAIHINRNIENQVAFGTALAEGFRQHGVDHNLTTSKTAPGDTHVIIGPWYAFEAFKNHDNVLYFDRACWDHPNYTSINWMSHGIKHWNWNIDRLARYHPPIRPWKNGNKLLVLCDYGDDGKQMAYKANPHYEEITVRRHPSNRDASRNSLSQDLDQHDIAFGGRSTALVTAAIDGLRVLSYDKTSPVAPIAGRVAYINVKDRSQWLRDLSWHNWNLNEVRTGAAWEHLRQHTP
jgi:hypothetical protein